MALGVALQQAGRMLKARRYLLVSVVNVVFGESILALTFGVLNWPAMLSNLVATAVGTVPGYFLCRRWIWQRNGRSRWVREVATFWGLALVGLALSTLAAGQAELLVTQANLSRFHQTLFVMASTIVAFAIVWIARFFILDRLLFAAPPVAHGDCDLADPLGRVSAAPE